MKYIPGSYTQAQLKKAIDEVEIALTNRFLRDGVITDAAEKRSWREAVEKASFGRNTVMYDDQGNPSVMVVFPLQTEADLLTGGRNMPHPAFIVNGNTKPLLYISKYQCITTGAGATLRALSLKHQDPANTINFDNALLACKQKGTGWHLMTNAEWAAIALWCKKQGFWPRGNNNYGKDTAVATEKGIPSYYYDSTGTKYIGRVLTGSGPVAWSHDGSPFGIFDLNGNVYEWVGGMRLNVGEIQIIADNNAADNTKDQTATSALWMAMLQDGSLVYTKWVTGTAYALNFYITSGGKVYKATTGGMSGAAEPVWPANVNDTVNDGTVVWTRVADLTLKYDSTGVDSGVSADVGDIKVSTSIVNSLPNSYAYNTFQTTVANAGVTIPNLLKLLGLFPIDSDHGSDGHYMRNTGERLPFRGGFWSGTSSAGVFYLGLAYPRSLTDSNVGFRAAFVL